METINFEQFAAIDIRIGKICAVDVVEGADKLLKLTVDVGDADGDGAPITRQIISGIREYFEDPQFIVGTHCPFVCNLEPRTIRGLESQGMIMAADHQDTFAFLEPSNALPVGTKVR